MLYILARLGESATWAGIAALLGGVGLNLDPGLWQHIVTAGIALAGLAAFVIREAEKPAPVVITPAAPAAPPSVKPPAI